jgi:putative ABC transport system ATP-binding protein
VSLRMTGVSHSYERASPVLENVDLEVGTGETVAIVGPSGSGKTTLLSILGGLLRPSLGSVTLDGEPVGRPALPPGSVSWVFQTINLLGRRTAAENVAVGLLAAGSRSREVSPAVAEMLDRVGLSGFDDRLAMRLSGGQAQRVGVARAMVGDPRFVLADEPTGHLDQSTSVIVAEVLFQARPPATSLIAATHDRVIAERCQRAYRLVDGQLIPIPA